MRAQIALLPGDGIGPEVVAEGVRVLDAVAERWGHTFETTPALIGGAAIDGYRHSSPRRDGRALPRERCRAPRRRWWTGVGQSSLEGAP